MPAGKGFNCPPPHSGILVLVGFGVVSCGLSESAIVARVNGELWDLLRPLEADSSVELLEFDNEAAKAVYWHSSAHLLGAAMEHLYGGLLCRGPPTEYGFFYDIFMNGRKDGVKFERVSKRFIRMLPELEGLSDRERLGLFSLERRRLR
eukprot:g27490.t1